MRSAATSTSCARTGSPARRTRSVERIGEFAELGATRIYLQVLDLADLDHLDLIASEVTAAASEHRGRSPSVRASRARRRPAPPRPGCGRRSSRSPPTGSCAPSPRTGTACPAMSATVAPSRAATRTSRSRPVSGDAPPASVAAASAGSTTRSPRAHPAHGIGQLLGRRVLHDEAERAGLHRPPQVPGPAERGQDDHAAGRQLVRQRRGGRQPVHARASRCRAARRPGGPRAPPRRPRRPRPTWATTSKSSSSSSSAASADRTSAWSSASSSRIIARAASTSRHRGTRRSRVERRPGGGVARRRVRGAESARTRQPRTVPPVVIVPPAASTRSRSPRQPVAGSGQSRRGRRRRSRSSAARARSCSARRGSAARRW